MFLGSVYKSQGETKTTEQRWNLARGRRECPPSLTMSGHPFKTEVLGRLGVLPNFFCSARSAPGLIEELWGFAKLADLDSPLPSVFKERQFVHFSRFCAVRHCVVRHGGDS